LRTLLYVGNLGEGTSAGDLHSLFSPFGELRGIEVTPKGLLTDSVASAFVEFSDVFGAEAARRELDGRLLSGARISVTAARLGQQRTAAV
jgi:hypothetical protein